MAKRLTTEEARARALTSARELVAERGITGLTIDSVSERSGVAKTTIYRRWPSIEELRIDAVNTFVSELPTPNTGRLEDDLLAIHEMFVDSIERSGLRALIMSVVSATSNDPRLAEIRRQLMDSSGNPIRTVLELAIARQELPSSLDLSLATDFVRGPVFIRRIIDGTPIDETQLARLTAAIATGLVALASNE